MLRFLLFAISLKTKLLMASPTLGLELSSTIVGGQFSGTKAGQGLGYELGGMLRLQFSSGVFMGLKSEHLDVKISGAGPSKNGVLSLYGASVGFTTKTFLGHLSVSGAYFLTSPFKVVSMNRHKVNSNYYGYSIQETYTGSNPYGLDIKWLWIGRDSRLRRDQSTSLGLFIGLRSQAYNKVEYSLSSSHTSVEPNQLTPQTGSYSGSWLLFGLSGGLSL